MYEASGMLLAGAVTLLITTCLLNALVQRMADKEKRERPALCDGCEHLEVKWDDAYGCSAHGCFVKENAPTYCRKYKPKEKT